MSESTRESVKGKGLKGLDWNAKESSSHAAGMVEQAKKRPDDAELRQRDSDVEDGSEEEMQLEVSFSRMINIGTALQFVSSSNRDK